MVDLAPMAVTDLDVFENVFDLRRDLLIFVEYMQTREVKRLHRTNGLPKADALRLAKLMSDPDAEADVRQEGWSAWLDFVDSTALKLGLVSYDTKGEYAGYSSVEPSFPDNYIIFNKSRFEQYLGQSLLEQELNLLDGMLNEADGCHSEFFQARVLSRLDRFSPFGCATGVVPGLDFPHIRRFLLDLLHTCQPGIWYSAGALIQHLKQNNLFFLIPQTPRYSSRWDRREGRYGNFRESKSGWGYEIDIPEQAPDGFERVEGRYIERFLEGIPLVLGYVDVAYSRQQHKGPYPSRGQLQAFRVNSRLMQVMGGEIPQPAVTIQPNFEVYVESAFYPASVLAKLRPLCEVVSEDVLTILKLDKARVAAQAAQDSELDVIRLLADLSGRELPANIRRELSEWVAHSEKFELYEGFGLFEGDADPPLADPFTVKQITSSLRIIHSPQDLYRRLEEAEQIPLRVTHPEARLAVQPDAARTVFMRRSEMPKPKPKEKEAVKILRQTHIVLHLPSVRVLKAFHKALLDARCPVEVDQKNKTIAFAGQHEAQVTKVLKQLEGKYNIQIDEI